MILTALSMRFSSWRMETKMDLLINMSLVDLRKTSMMSCERSCLFML